MMVMSAVVAWVAMNKSTSSNKIFTNWKSISTMLKFIYDVANVQHHYQHLMKVSSWIMARRWHAKDEWVAPPFFYLLPFSRNNFLLCVMLITNIANWSDEKLSVAEYKKKETLNATKNRIENSKIIFYFW